MTEKAIIRIRDVSFAFEGGKTLFSGLSEEITAGSFTLVRGPSGAGKSTLLRILCRLEEPADGTLYFLGEPYDAWPAMQLRKKVLYLQQTPVVISGDVRTNLLLPFAFEANHDLARPSDDTLRLGLDDLMMSDVELTRQAQALSVGQRQRLCLLRAMLLDPEVLLLDEPTSALDTESSRVVQQTAEAFCRRGGKAVVMVSHGDYTPSSVSPRMLDVGSEEVRA